MDDTGGYALIGARALNGMRVRRPALRQIAQQFGQLASAAQLYRLHRPADSAVQDRLTGSHGHGRLVAMHQLYQPGDCIGSLLLGERAHFGDDPRSTARIAGLARLELPWLAGFRTVISLIRCGVVIRVFGHSGRAG